MPKVLPIVNSILQLKDSECTYSELTHTHKHAHIFTHTEYPQTHT